MACNDNKVGSGNCKYIPQCSTYVKATSYYVSMTDISNGIKGQPVPLPTFAPNMYESICVFNNTNKVIQINYKGMDCSKYSIELPPFQFYTHTLKDYIHHGSISIRSLNGSPTYGKLELYFNASECQDNS